MGEYITELAKDILNVEGDRFLKKAEEQALLEIGDIGREKIVSTIKDDLSSIGVEFEKLV
ncbi:MAG: hypothetical protein CM1200mP22_13780 [Dehalococcoidia bacterium]|nr:MAG: hypothetical protein CM1200mP22_13780 [Dehalococcoidia bacterium]